jgi:hypothetical protein
MAKRKKKPAPVTVIEPTPEQFATGTFERAGLAYRRKPVIDSLRDAGKLNAREYAALAYYREQAHQAEDDYAQTSPLAPEKIMGGRGGVVISGGLPAKLLCTPAILETGRIELLLGRFFPIARAIAVDDMTLAQWCIRQHGGREKADHRGRVVAIVPACGKETLKLALFNLRAASARIAP